MSESSTMIVAVIVIITMVVVLMRQRCVGRNAQTAAATVKARLEDDLRQARSERDQLLDALGDAFLLLNSNDHVLYANRAAFTLFSDCQLIGWHISEVFRDKKLIEALDRSLSAEGTFVSRVFTPHSASPLGDSEQSGVHTWMIDAARVSGSAEKKFTTRIVIRDVTAEHEYEQIRKDFVANASHELRTPLAIIHGYLENLLDDGLLEDPELSRRFLKIMRKHTRRIIRIVEDMLVISRLESGEAAALKIKPFRVSKCIMDVLQRLESMIQAQSATVTMKLPDESLKIAGDKFYWTQVIFNLVENALKQNPEAGLKITVGCVAEGEQIRMWISDNGLGIPAEDIPHVFRRFYRVEKQLSRENIGGTGLGLSIVKRAVEAHGGTIEVTSVPYHDTRFTIRVPKRAR